MTSQIIGQGLRIKTNNQKPVVEFPIVRHKSKNKATFYVYQFNLSLLALIGESPDWSRSNDRLVNIFIFCFKFGHLHCNAINSKNGVRKEIM